MQHHYPYLQTYQGLTTFFFSFDPLEIISSIDMIIISMLEVNNSFVGKNFRNKYSPFPWKCNSKGGEHSIAVEMMGTWRS